MKLQISNSKPQRSPKPQNPKAYSVGNQRVGLLPKEFCALNGGITFLDSLLYGGAQPTRSRRSTDFKSGISPVSNRRGRESSGARHRRQPVEEAQIPLYILPHAETIN